MKRSDQAVLITWRTLTGPAGLNPISPTNQPGRGGQGRGGQVILDHVLPANEIVSSAPPPAGDTKPVEEHWTGASNESSSLPWAALWWRF
mmetsp:Transcript_2567/g.2826  ORF Transcript_2567/g.2826 Transcript_2567/m.2826 type:complete len:90 (-) Transcript_2567:437-706(-)